MASNKSSLTATICTANQNNRAIVIDCQIQIK